MNRLSVVSRVMLLAAFALAAGAVAEGLAQLLGASLTGRAYPAGRLLEFAGIVMVFAIGTVLTEIRDELRAARRG